MNDYDIIFKNYKCFEDITKIEDLSRINIFIGKNNIGKSTIIDVIGYINGERFSISKDTEICESQILNEEILKKYFSSDIPAKRREANEMSEYDYASKNLNSRILRSISYLGSSMECSLSKLDPLYSKFTNTIFHNKLNIMLKNTKQNNIRFVKIASERDILPEYEISMYDTVKIDKNGTNLTSLLAMYLNSSRFDCRKGKKELLDKFNEIMGEETQFVDIIPKIVGRNQKNVNCWEVFMDDGKECVALSESGSGLKTILFILVSTIIVPYYENNDISSYVYAFEEIENNLHPSLLRRTLHYLEEVASKGAQIYLSTHSNVMIDAFSNSDNVSVYEVYKENDDHKIRRIDDYNKKNSCLNELGIKASDILQSNGIIWVEGPSDRIYINKWIELWSGGRYREGMNYQCMIYGGKLLADEEFQEETSTEFINLLNMNRNSMIIMDSDISNKDENIRNTKKRIIKECNDKGLLSIVTDGREIENYIPQEIINEVFKLTNPSDLEKYEKISEYLEDNKKGLKQKFINGKVSYAKEISEKMSFGSMKQSEGLDDKMTSIIKKLEKWNKE